jgi:hypothetical protein
MSPAKGRLYCSVKCAREASRSQYFKICLQCGNEFLLKNKAYERRGGGKFCSNQCGRTYNRTYHCNEDYFASIDTERKAYWFGFLMADGYNSGNEVVVNLKRTDDNHLLKFLQDIQGDHSISYGIDRQKYKGNILVRKKASVRISSMKMCADLHKLGCVRAKSLILKFPDFLPADLLPHFLRGYFDGDGCVDFMGRNKHLHRITFYSGSHAFMLDLESYLNKQGIECHVDKHGKTIRLTKQDRVAQAFALMYTGGSVRLERKYERFCQNLS